MLDTTLNKVARQNAGNGAGGCGVRWKACVTTSGHKTRGMGYEGWGTMDRARNNHAGQNEGDGAGGGGVRWIVYATSSRKIMRGMGQQGVGYAG